MKKIVALVTSTLLLLLTVSCSGKLKTETASELSSESLYSLKTADISVSEDFSEILCLDSTDDTAFVFGKLSDNSYGGFTSDLGMKSFNGFTFEPSENESVISASQINKEKFAILTYADEQTFIRIFNTNGSEAESYECVDILSDEASFVKFYASNDCFYINENNDTITCIDNTGTICGTVVLNGKNILGTVNNCNEPPIVLLSNIDNKSFIASISGTSLSDVQECSNVPGSLLAACKGKGEYSVIGVFDDAMYGLKGNEWVKLTNFMDNDFNTYNVQELIMDSEDSFIFCMNNGEKTILKRVTKRSDAENMQRLTITMAMLYSDPQISYLIKNYNSSSDKYMVEAKIYCDDPSDKEALKQACRNFKMDLVSGNAPDIFPYSLDMPVDSFGAKESIFCDLYEFIDNDLDLKRGDFVDGFLEGLSSHGKLLMITPSFTIKTITCKDKYLEGTTDWNYDRMMEIYLKNADKTDLSLYAKFSSSRDAFINVILYDPFIDYEKGTCNFTDDNFIKMMKFFKENEIGSSNNSGNFTSDVIPELLQTDQIMLNVVDASNFLYLTKNSIEKIDFHEPASIIGYPTENGSLSYVEVNSGFSIFSNSDNKDGAWDFIKQSCFSDSYYHGTEGRNLFPAIEKYMDEQLDHIQTLYENDEEQQGFAPMTDSEREQCKAFAKSAAKNVIKRDQNVIPIIYEEIGAYFNGERSAEESALIIQDRISLYLSENYQ